MLLFDYYYLEESLGLDTLKNALKLFESWKILTYRLQNSQKLYSLRKYYNDAFKLKDLIDRIAKYKSWDGLDYSKKSTHIERCKVPTVIWMCELVYFVCDNVNIIFMAYMMSHLNYLLYLKFPVALGLFYSTFLKLKCLKPVSLAKVHH